MEINSKAIILNTQDNVAVALKDIQNDTLVSVNGEEIKVTSTIACKHKFTLKAIPKGEDIFMYGVVVGKAIYDIPKGSLITTENIEHNTMSYSINDNSNNKEWKKPDVSAFENRTFNGYHREDGKVGTENNWLVIPLVFCQNRNIEVIKDAILDPLGFSSKPHLNYDVNTLINAFQSGKSEEEIENLNIQSEQKFSQKSNIFPNVDGVKFLTHQGGCGGSTDDSIVLCRLLAGYINNPNVAGATVLSLGCQHAQIDILKTHLSKISKNASKPVCYLEQQDSNSEKEFISEAIKKTFLGLVKANKITRKPAPLKHLTIGLECGGSDGFSGISANPVLGHLSDMLVAIGGATILAEFPELNGVEQELINRCYTEKKAEKFSELMSDYNQRAEKLGSGFYANPSPGNIKDGLITDAIKSAGAAKKGGSSPIVDVLDYTEQVTSKGLNLLCTPGNDVESTTGLAGSGANVILFTTGLGTPTGNPITPVIKVSTNNKLAEKMPDLIDFNTGEIIEGKTTITEAAEELFELVIKLASGEYTTKSRLLEQDDFIPWKRGISL